MTHFLSSEGAGLYLYYTYWFWTLCFRTSFSVNPLSLYTIIIVTGSEGEFFLILVKIFQPLALVIRNSVLHLAGLLDPPLFNVLIL